MHAYFLLLKLSIIQSSSPGIRENSVGLLYILKFPGCSGTGPVRVVSLCRFPEGSLEAAETLFTWNAKNQIVILS